ncbi:rhoa signaling inhibitor [Cetacean poxvirus 1]|nr:rhoa signaling inhibitor [Cetacean poxvirus 1]
MNSRFLSLSLKRQKNKNKIMNKNLNMNDYTNLEGTKNYQSHTYIEQRKSVNALTDCIYVSKLPIDVTNLIKEEEFSKGFQIEQCGENCETVYSWKKVNVKSCCLEFLLDNEGYFCIKTCYLFKLEHGDGFISDFNKCIVNVGNCSGFLATICIKNDGVSGIHIPYTEHIKTQVSPGDYFISRSSRGIVFLPQIGGSSYYLIACIEPSSALLYTGLLVNSYSIDKNINKESSSIIADIIEKRMKVLKLVNNIIDVRVHLEELYVTSCILIEVKYVYKIRYADRVKSTIISELDKADHQLNNLIDEAKKVNIHSIDHKNFYVSCYRKKTIASSNIHNVKELFKCDDYYQNEDIVSAMIKNDLIKLYNSIDSCWKNIEDLFYEISLLIDNDVKYINSYIIKVINKSLAAEERDNIADKLKALSNIGFMKA